MSAKNHGDDTEVEIYTFFSVCFFRVWDWCSIFVSNPSYDDAHIKLYKERRTSLVGFGEQTSWGRNHFSLAISTGNFCFVPEVVIFCAVEMSGLQLQPSRNITKSRGDKFKWKNVVLDIHTDMQKVLPEQAVDSRGLYKPKCEAWEECEKENFYI